MSHENAEPGRGVLYTLPSLFSDTLRTREFSQFFREYDGASFSVRTLDGWSWSSSVVRVPQFIVIFSTRHALDDVIEDASETTLGRLFLEGGVELRGNILILLSVAQYTLRHSEGLSHGLIQTIARMSHEFSRKLIPIHRTSGKHSWHCAPCPLDLPVSFFEPWLGTFLGHSYCCLADDEEGSEAAQRKSFDRACEWLELEQGDRLLDVGCGWGSLLIHAAERYGAYPQGITSTQMQSVSTIERIRRRGLERQCSVEQRDLHLQPYRSREFNKIAHLGIFEQVGTADMPEYLLCLKRMLAPGGLVLLHRLTSSPEGAASMTLLPSDFLSDGISRELQLAERAGFDLVGLESIHAEYEQTLRMWIEHLLDPQLAQSTRVFSNGYRAWMLYLIEVATCLNSGEARVHRLLLRRRK
jgi:cyclopropane-fatty-acyl-phospholipid synthase